MTPSDSVDKMDRFVTFLSVRPTSVRCVYRAELILLLGSDTVTVYWQIFAVYRTQLITRSWHKLMLILNAYMATCLRRQTEIRSESQTHTDSETLTETADSEY